MRRRLFCAVLMMSLPACGAAQKKPFVDAAMADTKTRHELVEAVLRNLDQHPQYVDEMYRAARHHPPTMDRLEADAARDLADPVFAKSTAAIAVREPAGVAQAMTAITQAMVDQPVTLAAVDHALTEHASDAIAIVKDDHEAMEALLRESVRAAEKGEKARAALVSAIQKTAPDLMKLLARDPNVLRALVDPIFNALDATPESKQALAAAVQNAAPRLVQVASRDPKLLAQLTEAMLKASLNDKPALKQLLKKLLID
ncbi:MAG: hypothetical protein ABI461_23170 [Polyangiaceae bacterium]